jgi:hypothetical protein
MKTLLMAAATFAALMAPALAQHPRMGNLAGISLAIGSRDTHPPHPYLAMLRPPPAAGMDREWRSLAASVQPLPALRLVAGFGERERGHTVFGSDAGASWVVGANYSISRGLFQLGYARNTPQRLVPARRLSIGYEYPLSRHATLFADASHRKAEQSVRYYGIGLRTSY